EAVGKILVTDKRTLNPSIVGRPAEFIADLAGVKIPTGTRCLLADTAGVGRDIPGRSKNSRRPLRSTLRMGSTPQPPAATRYSISAEWATRRECTRQTARRLSAMAKQCRRRGS